MKSIVLTPNPDIDISFLFTLLDKLNIDYQVMETASLKQPLTQENKTPIQRLRAIAGSWKSDLSGEQLVNAIYNARQDAPRNME